MLSADIKQLILVEEDKDTPKYLQISNGVIRAIEKRILCKGDQLPSIRQLSDQLDISFDTAKKAYDVLKKRNIVVAAHGKSNVVNATGPLPEYKIFLLVNELGSHQKLLYDAFIHTLSPSTEIDLYTYNNSPLLFHHLLQTKKAGYTHCVIVPCLLIESSETLRIIMATLRSEKVISLRKQMHGFGSVHEDFDNDIYSALSEARAPLFKYDTLNLVLPADNCYPPEIIRGFVRFCDDHGFQYNIMNGFCRSSALNKGEVFITLSDDDLASVIHLAESMQYKIGEDVGLISYNETPLKEVLLDGITTISTDFRKMGELAALQVINNSADNIAMPSRLTLRSSL